MKRILIHMDSRVEQHLLSGNSFRIDKLLERRDGNIYMDRTYVRHPSISRARSMILPNHHLWVMFWEGHGAPHEQVCYMHMAAIRDEGATVVIEDLYLDVVVGRDGRWSLLDIDEFRQAVASGELSTVQVQTALEGLENACRLVQTAGVDIEAHLRRTLSREGA